LFENISGINLLQILANNLVHQSYQKLSQLLNNDEGIEQYQKGFLVDKDLLLLAGYYDFLLNLFILTDKEKLDIEFRFEKRSGNLGTGYLGYALIPLSASIIHTWTHVNFTQSADLVQERFFNNKSGKYLFGSYLGRSKFYSLTDISSEWSKEKVIEVLGISGYDKIKKQGPLYIVQVKLNSEIIDKLQLKVPIIYKSKSDDNSWEMVNNFLVNSIPGYTANGICEVLGKTFEIEAANLDELQKKGVKVMTFT